MKNITVKTAFGETERVILKHKVPEFDETRNQKGTKKKAAGMIIILIYINILPFILAFLTFIIYLQKE